MRRARAGVRAGLFGLLSLLAASLLLGPCGLDLFASREVQMGEPRAGAPRPASDAEEELTQFTRFVLTDVQDTFEAELRERGQPYAAPRPRFFVDRARSLCGRGEPASGSFYCAEERRVYVDLGLYRALRRRDPRAGDLGQAYLLAHLLGHHLQTALGVTAQIERRARQRPQQREELLARAELQADCFAGLWARAAFERELLGEGDLREGMEAAVAILREREAEGGVELPERLGGVSRAAAARAMQRGFESGRLEACELFARDAL